MILANLFISFILSVIAFGFGYIICVNAKKEKGISRFLGIVVGIIILLSSFFVSVKVLLLMPLHNERDQLLDFRPKEQIGLKQNDTKMRFPMRDMQFNNKKQSEIGGELQEESSFE